jgi:hypothetical protein
MQSDPAIFGHARRFCESFSPGESIKASRLRILWLAPFRWTKRDAFGDQKSFKSSRGTVVVTIAVQAGEIQATKYVPYSSFV